MQPRFFLSLSNRVDRPAPRTAADQFHDSRNWATRKRVPATGSARCNAAGGQARFGNGGLIWQFKPRVTAAPRVAAVGEPSTAQKHARCAGAAMSCASGRTTDSRSRIRATTPSMCLLTLHKTSTLPCTVLAAATTPRGPIPDPRRRSGTGSSAAPVP